MSKRKFGESSINTDFAVIETIRGDADVVVELVPNVWLKPAKKGKAVKARETAKCYYPRRKANQTIDKYMKWLKLAKFECLKPKNQNDKNWDVIDCKVLKMGIASFDEAVQAEQLFSDFFNTTDAEAEMRSRASPQKRLRKTRKPNKDVTSESESDGEVDSFVLKDANIPDFNAAFKHPSNHHIAETDSDSDEQMNNRSIGGLNNQTGGGQLPNTESNNISQLFNNTLAAEPIVPVANNTVHIECIEQDIPFEAVEGEVAPESGVVFEFIDQRRENASNSKCNCSQKLMNKMDYMQKRFLKELGRYRQEMLQVIRQFSDRYDVLLNSREFQTPELENQVANQDQDDAFEMRFETSFPVTTKLDLIETNETIKSDRDFKKRLINKLTWTVADEKTSEQKLIRKLLKAICSSSCMSEFTWLGTETKMKFSALESLIAVITCVVERQFPNCNAFTALKQVVQQRAKSAAEFEAKKRLNNTATAQSDVNYRGYESANPANPEWSLMVASVANAQTYEFADPAHSFSASLAVEERANVQEAQV